MAGQTVSRLIEKSVICIRMKRDRPRLICFDVINVVSHQIRLGVASRLILNVRQRRASVDNGY